MGRHDETDTNDELESKCIIIRRVVLKIKVCSQGNAVSMCMEVYSWSSKQLKSILLL